MSTKDEQIVKVEGQVTKVEGWIDREALSDFKKSEERFRHITMTDENVEAWDIPVVMLIGVPHWGPIAPEGSTQVPRVWTEQQIRALRDDINKLKKQFVDLVCAGSGDIHVELEAVNDLFAKHGITLAP